MENIDNFYYNSNYILFVKKEEFSEETQKYIIENSSIEIRVYLSTLGSLNDEIKYIIPSIILEDGNSQQPIKFAGRERELFEWIPEIKEECYDFKSGKITINTEKLLEMVKAQLVNSLNFIVLLFFKDETELEEIEKEVVKTHKFRRPWLIDNKIIRKEKLKRLKQKSQHH